MMCFTTGKVIELNRRGFVIEGSTGFKQQIGTMHSGWKLDLAVGDEVKVNGGMNKDVFASSTIDVFRSGKWEEVKDGPRSLIGGLVFFAAMVCCIVVFLILTGGALFWFALR